MTRIGLVLPVLLTLGLLLSGCSSESDVAQLGKLAPGFELESLDGQTVSLSDLRGQGVMLNFWHSECIPCETEMPYLQEIHEGLDDSSAAVVILTVNLGESPSAVADFMKYHKLTLTVLFDSDFVVAEKYNIQWMPTTYFIDKDGIVQDKVLGAFPNKSAIEGRLAKITP